jgi:hypothetical protein
VARNRFNKSGKYAYALFEKPFSWIERHPQSHTKRLLHNCCDKKLRRTISHNFSFVLNATIFNLKMEATHLFETLVCTYESILLHNAENNTVIFSTERTLKLFSVLISKKLFGWIYYSNRLYASPFHCTWPAWLFVILVSCRKLLNSFSGTYFCLHFLGSCGVIGRVMLNIGRCSPHKLGQSRVIQTPAAWKTNRPNISYFHLWKFSVANYDDFRQYLYCNTLYCNNVLYCNTFYCKLKCKKLLVIIAVLVCHVYCKMWDS